MLIFVYCFTDCGRIEDIRMVVCLRKWVFQGRLIINPAKNDRKRTHIRCRLDVDVKED